MDFYKVIEESCTQDISSVQENFLVKSLRGLPDFDTYRVLEEMRKSKSRVTLRVAKRVLNRKDLVVNFFKEGVSESNAQGIRMWLEFALPKLGARTVVRLISDMSADRKDLLDMATYHLLALIPQEQLDALLKENSK